jgi:antitoxin component of MazEF toxin-antitoxin module
MKMITYIRAVIKNGNSLALGLPIKAVQAHNVKPKDKLTIAYNRVEQSMSILLNKRLKPADNTKVYTRSAQKNGDYDSLQIGIPVLIVEMEGLELGNELKVHYDDANGLLFVDFEEVVENVKENSNNQSESSNT